jgi:hypothetical protein
MTVPSALLSHASTEHYTPQYILNDVIACMGAIDPDPCNNSQEIPNVPAARHYTQDNGLIYAIQHFLRDGNKNGDQRIISISNFSASSLYLFLIVTSVTPATSATSRWVRRSPPRIDEI